MGVAYLYLTTFVHSNMWNMNKTLGQSNSCSLPPLQQHAWRYNCTIFWIVLHIKNLYM